ncbi:hypothetical protein THAOC_04574 [Thalassiosira oceanica]|uniref:PPIase cyclophilin-type domain-containing protein n=1 Tax=Thalassiosira oceanica TaxID=159749 RepID=K0TNT2_THAOC|nr:hypothetical protein THAOC_04574 [Thalassiosira oceanica]|eukprot:EJK73787.1 hypothetical protein THAOC_04574 [Thalassiosira oceanica]
MKLLLTSTMFASAAAFTTRSAPARLATRAFSGSSYLMANPKGNIFAREKRTSGRFVQERKDLDTRVAPSIESFLHSCAKEATSPNENFDLKHEGKGKTLHVNSVRAAIFQTKGKCLGQVFFLWPMDGNHCVFGKVVDGLDVVDKIESVGSQSGATAAPVIVKASGELTE